MTVQRRNLMIAAAAAGLSAPHLVGAQGAWPDRPLRLIVPWPPGGSTDIIARVFQPQLQAILGRPVVVENHPGSSGAAGAQEAARAAPDGATWMLAFDSEATNQTTMRLPYRTMEAFAPVTLVATGPLALVAHQFAPYATYADVVRAARRDPARCATPPVGLAGWHMLPPHCCSRPAATGWSTCPTRAAALPRRTRWPGACRCSCPTLSPSASTSARGRCDRLGYRRAR
jgi:tripartite-type tricarboxylate transporter receptor subunit TctC